MSAYDNNGIISHLTLNGCTVINHGTIAHLDGTNNHIDNRGTIAHNEGGRVIVAGSYQRMEPQVKVVYKDRIVYRDRVVYKDKIQWRDRVIYKNSDKLAEKQRKAYQEDIAELRTSNDDLRDKLGWANHVANDLRCRVQHLEELLEHSDRRQMEEKIAELQEQLKRSENRERVLKMKADDAIREAQIAKSQVWDDFKPTKEQVKAYYKATLAMMDCEDEY